MVELRTQLIPNTATDVSDFIARCFEVAQHFAQFAEVIPSMFQGGSSSGAMPTTSSMLAQSAPGGSTTLQGNTPHLTTISKNRHW